MKTSDNDLIAENKQLKDCLHDISSRMEIISKNSFDLIHSTKSDVDIYNKVYRINQEAHDITHLIDTYYP